MAQTTHGLRAVLSLPAFYNLFQNVVGAQRARKILCREHFRINARDVVVDVGCGPAAILDYLDPSVRYYGFDLSQPYIDAARASYGERGTFSCSDVTELPASDIPPCQVAIAVGVLHHLDDADARRLIANLHQRLEPGGRLVTVDPAYWPTQSSLGRLLISRDRGQNVRTGEGYRELAASIFSDIRLVRRDDLLNIPYSHAVLECTK